MELSPSTLGLLESMHHGRPFNPAAFHDALQKLDNLPEINAIFDAQTEGCSGLFITAQDMAGAMGLDKPLVMNGTPKIDMTPLLYLLTHPDMRKNSDVILQAAQVMVTNHGANTNQVRRLIGHTITPQSVISERETSASQGYIPAIITDHSEFYRLVTALRTLRGLSDGTINNISDILRKGPSSLDGPRPRDVLSPSGRDALTARAGGSQNPSGGGVTEAGRPVVH